MSTLKVDTINTSDGSGNITLSRPTILQAGDIITADLADNAITLAKMAGGTDGQIITYDTSGNPVAVGPGTSGQVLTSAGAGAPPTFAAAAGGVTVKTVTATYNLATASGTQDVTGFGFQPSAFITHCFVDSVQVACWGHTDFVRSQVINMQHGAARYTGDGHASPGYAFRVETGSSDRQIGAVTALADGFRITWSKVGSPTGTVNLYTLGFQ